MIWHILVGSLNLPVDVGVLKSSISLRFGGSIVGLVSEKYILLYHPFFNCCFHRPFAFLIRSQPMFFVFPTLLHSQSAVRVLYPPMRCLITYFEIYCSFFFSRSMCVRGVGHRSTFYLIVNFAFTDRFIYLFIPSLVPRLSHYLILKFRTCVWNVQLFRFLNILDSFLCHLQVTWKMYR